MRATEGSRRATIWAVVSGVPGSLEFTVTGAGVSVVAAVGSIFLGLGSTATANGSLLGCAGDDSGWLTRRSSTWVAFREVGVVLELSDTIKVPMTTRNKTAPPPKAA